MLPSATDLTYFLEAAQSLNFSRASERLGITQPSLSLAIQRLEQSLDTPLFFRSKKGVSLTPAGKVLHRQGLSLLESWAQVKQQAHSALHEAEGWIRVGCHPSVALYSLPEALPGLIEKYPRMNFELKHDLSRKIAESVISGSLELGIVVNPTRHPDLVIQRLCNDEVTFWRASHSRYSMDSLKNRECHLICDPELLQTQNLLRKTKKLSTAAPRILHSGNLELIAALTAHDAGIGILPTRVAHRQGKLVPIPKSPHFVDEVCLAYRVENKNVKSLKVVCEALKSYFSRTTGSLKKS